MAKRLKGKSAKKAKSTDLSPKPDLAYSVSLAEALKNLNSQTLEALVFGYLAGRNASGLQSSAPILPNSEAAIADATLFYQDFDALCLRSESTLEVASAVAPAVASKNPSRAIANIIVGTFKRINIPVTTATVPKSVVIFERWQQVGKSILADVAHRYPKFTPHADPKNAEPFFNHPLIVLATEIRSKIV